MAGAPLYAFGSRPRPYGDNTFGWFLKSAFRFKEPIPFRGALGLFEVPDELVPKRTWKVLKNGQIVESQIPGRYAGYKIDKIFGRLDCASGMRMKKENRVFFLAWEDAIAEGYRPCKTASRRRTIKALKRAFSVFSEMLRW